MNRKMYLTTAEHKALNLPSTEEQISRHNALVSKESNGEEIAKLTERIEQMRILYDLAIDNQIRWMHSAQELLEACKYMHKLLVDMGHGGLAGAILGENVIERADFNSEHLRIPSRFHADGDPVNDTEVQAQTHDGSEHETSDTEEK